MESKRVSSGWRSAALAVEGKFSGDVVATRTVGPPGLAWAVPASVLALFVEWAVAVELEGPMHRR